MNARGFLTACAVLAAVGAAAAASGLAGRLIDSDAGEPAPAPVRRQPDLASRRPLVIPWFRQQPESRAIAARARGVLAIDTSVGPVYVWVAPTRGGGSCRMIDIEANTLPDGSPNLSGTCSPRPARSDGPFLSGPVDGATFVSRGDLRLLHGRVGAEVASVELRFDGGGTAMLRPVEGFFLRELRPGEEPVAVVAHDASGRELGRRPMPGPRSFRRDLAFPTGPYRNVIEIDTSAGFPMTFAVAPGTNGSVCERTIYRGAQAWGCGPGHGGLEADAIDVHPGLWNENEDRKAVKLLEGSVGRRISRLEVWYEDGGAARIPIVERYVLFEVPTARTPRVLVGMDARGSIVARRSVSGGG
jgi:hypothetical protein